MQLSGLEPPTFGSVEAQSEFPNARATIKTGIADCNPLRFRPVSRLIMAIWAICAVHTARRPGSVVVGTRSRSRDRSLQLSNEAASMRRCMWVLPFVRKTPPP